MSAVKVRVYHDYYGCDTGRCGHTVKIEGGDGVEHERFEFTHPYKEAQRSRGESLDDPEPPTPITRGRKAKP